MLFNIKITIIGSGNVATHLGRAFYNKGFIINEVFSRDIDNAKLLAKKLKCKASNKIENINPNSTIYIICIKDDFIEEISKKMAFTNKIVVHTSGSVSMDILKQFKKYGIFYPLQTFTKTNKIKLPEVPFCIEASDKKTEQFLSDLAKTLSNNVFLINSEQRKKLHLAAVFACNFSNYMYQIANNITSENNIEFNILKPLILETAKKIKTNTPKSVQTGPAVRKDEEVIKKHLKLLENKDKYQKIYHLITECIKNSN